MIELPDVEALKIAPRFSQPGWPIRFRNAAIFFFAYLVVALTLQHLSGIYSAELGHDPDEPSHVTTALMIRDYLASGFHASPVRYAEEYYVHYPKVAIGMWPPFFHFTAAIWMLFAGANQNSMLLFMAVQCAALAATLALFARRFFAIQIAFALGLLLVFLPVIQAATSVFMVDIFLSAMEFWALLLVVKYFEQPRAAGAIAAASVIALALMTKGNANCLLLMLLLLLLLTRRFEILKSWHFYMAGGIVALFGLPWQLLSMWLYNGTIPMERFSFARLASLFTGYSGYLADQVGRPIFLLSLIGFSVETGRLLAHRKNHQVMALFPIARAGACALAMAILVFHCIAPVPGPNDRYMIPEAPLLLLFAALGVPYFAAALRIPGVTMTAKTSIIAAVALALFVKNTFAIPHRENLGMDRAAQEFATGSDDAVLVCSDSKGEGAFIVAMALRDVRPQHIVLRGSKLLSENPWFLVNYKPNFHSASELKGYLESVGAQGLIVDLTNTLWEQDRQLVLKMVNENPARWSKLDEINDGAHSRHILLYRRVGAALSPEARESVHVKMGATLGRDLVLKH